MSRSAIALLGLAGVTAFALSIVIAPNIQGVLGGMLAIVVLAIAWIDARTFIIPNALVLAGLVLGLASAALDDWSPTDTLFVAVVRGGTAFLLFALIRIVYRRVRKREGLGFGDVKLAGVAGVWLDWIPVAVAVEIAALGALTFFAFRHIRGQSLGRHGLIPFGVFLGPSIWLGWLLQTMASAF